jgi:hypothetical protein
MEGEYIYCPSCENIKEGALIYRCHNCKEVFCSACMIRPVFHSPKCPHCEVKNPLSSLVTGGGWTILGKIRRT